MRGESTNREGGRYTDRNEYRNDFWGLSSAKIGNETSTIADEILFYLVEIWSARARSIFEKTPIQHHEKQNDL